MPTRSEFMHLDGPLPKAVFYFLIALSLSLMVYQFWARYRLWMRGQSITWKPDPWGSILRYVIGQKKVQGSRPRSGAPMHLALFYGFLSLFAATSLLAIAKYAPLIGIPNFHKGDYYLAYEATFDFLGLFFVVGVVWAAGRRLVNDSRVRRGQPGFLGESDWRDYATLLILFALGTTGYFVEAARIANSPKAWDGASFVGATIATWLGPISPGAYVVVWWFHFAWVFGFFAFLPQMRVKHIVTATLTAAGSPNQAMGALSPVRLEDVETTGRIGVDLATHYSRWHLLSLDACMSCGRCTEVCPAYGAGKPLNPRKVVADIQSALVSGASVAAVVGEEELWACTTCNACVEACPVLIRHVDMIVDARRHLVAEGRFSGSGSVMLRQVGSTGNAWGAPASSREDWMKGLDIPLCRDGRPFEYLLWVGCAGATDAGAIRTTKAVAGLLQSAGVSFACLGQEEACTGDPARRIGDEFLFQEQATKNVSVFERYGVSKIVTPCPHCFNSLKNEYGDFGRTMQVEHHTELLARLIAEGRLHPAAPAQGSVVLHDPCYLARVNGIADAPRALVGESPRLDGDAAAVVRSLEVEPAGTKVLAEPLHHGRKTLCCGAGGGRMWSDEEPGRRPSERRIQELLATGASQVAVACPFCRIMLEADLKRGSEEVRLVDLAELLAEANP